MSAVKGIKLSGSFVQLRDYIPKQFLSSVTNKDTSSQILIAEFDRRHPH